ncbi:hypothetical protein ASPZODRAFT_61865 [Penicilliopsis zonata CBS 506.65]|uniref:Rrp15p-domain-containing protein n=1 Tax=Penicilliopsis zonata CBS 506.65 TaxID=1073090 RepID=A0A1L9SMH9_9EURO|nr:hypothetical protein ASPZODRAFT_61865 [Penicilliopsis zonata CBS 506.65]OJJ48469.1 hypothetical protein ASPZODRAFT_61865 [Penicilliopsis zonata CBS 506.65]
MGLSTSHKKRKVLEGMQGKIARPQKKMRKQREYHSSSEDEAEEDFKAVDLADSEEEEETTRPRKRPTEKVAAQKKTKSLGANKRSNAENPQPSSGESDDDNDDEADGDEDASDDDDVSMESDDGSDEDGDGAKSDRRKVSKRNDPTAFSTSISKILSTKLPNSARADPVLSRSQTAAQTHTDFADEKLETLARAKLRAEKKEDLDRGRVRDVMGIESGQAGEVAEEEKRLRKIAQRGVVKLFNAVRAAQVRGEQAAREERKKGTVGMGEREKAVNEVSKQGFLELISGKKGKPLQIEEA